MGFAESIEFHTMTTSEIKKKIQIVLEDPKYATNAKRISKRFKDQKEKPIDRAVWWIEWLLRNPDADYMKSPVLRLGYIIGNSYDLIAFISIAIFLILILVVKLVVMCFGTKRKDAIKYKRN